MRFRLVAKLTPKMVDIFGGPRNGENKRKRDAFRTRFENEQKRSFRRVGVRTNVTHKEC